MTINSGTLATFLLLVATSAPASAEPANTDGARPGLETNAPTPAAPELDSSPSVSTGAVVPASGSKKETHAAVSMPPPNDTGIVLPPAPANRPVEVQDGARLAPLGPLKIETPDATIKLGVLFQPQYEAVGNSSRDAMTHNLFVRRTRILVGATLIKNFDFFFETDFPNIFRAANNTAGEPNNRSTPGMNIQDAFATVKAAGNALKVDIGYTLPPLGHNALQGAANLLSWDYFTNSFRHGNVFGSTADPVGRDTGVQLRGLILNDMFEYRVGMYQGKRDGATGGRQQHV